ncbi:MAG TPA: hypothetical protein VJJ48_00130 [Candidatus Paceibacterota bacterium]
MKRTSIHSINADNGLNIVEKPLYFILNFFNNLYPYANLDPRIEIRNFNDSNWRSALRDTYKSSSVGRRLSDIYWKTLPWEKIKEELGEIHVFDTGCGEGNYGTRLSEEISSYTGVDAKKHENWQKLEAEHPNFKFIKSPSSKISELIPPETNLFITQSAIEHFDEDLLFFEEIKKFIDKTNKPVIQIHNFPARAVLLLYLFHGIRQYTPKTISKITKFFDNSHFYLYGLGGNAGKKVQWKYFTLPLLILGGKAKWQDDVERYNQEVIEAIEKDMRNPTPHPIFWVLIIHSNPINQIW